MNTWDRWPSETARAFNAFTMYRDTGPGRSLARVAADLDRAPSLIERWSRTWQWVARAAAWDDNQERARAVELAEERRQAARRHVAAAVKAQEIVAEALEALDPDDLSPADLIRWLDVAVRLERQALGIADRIEAATPQPVQQRADLDGLTPEERRARMIVLKRELESRLDAPRLIDDLDDGRRP